MPTAHRFGSTARWSTNAAIGIVAGLAVIGVSGCDADSAPAGGSPRQVTVVGTGEVQGVPDALTADVSIEFNAADVTTAMNQTGERTP